MSTSSAFSLELKSKEEILQKKFVVFIEKPENKSQALHKFRIYWQDISQAFDCNGLQLEAQASLPLSHIKAWIEAYRQSGFEIRVEI